ncbi:hypothetical protein [Gulosibacter bifidus]|uniref:DUF4190 domain-containing protein n=1 Tax=Gulosibacter bifidus TaxID=272239 RepID=A0ABW5RIC9_9MICO|nr:hypothetical protein [Gulosibacter bifidus]
MDTTVLIDVATIAICGIGAVLANPVIRFLLQRIAPAPAVDARGPQLLDAERELPGGRWIGILERIAVYASLVAAFPAGLAFVIAIKGLGRYPELRAQKNPRVGELFIIGTFASMLWAAAFAGIAVGVMHWW